MNHNPVVMFQNHIEHLEVSLSSELPNIISVEILICADFSKPFFVSGCSVSCQGQGDP